MQIPAVPQRIDVDDLRRRLGDDDLIATALQMFVEHGPAQLAAVKTAIETRRPDAVRRSAHMLKGSAGSVSAKSIAAAAAALESVARRNESEDFERLFEVLSHEVERLIEELR